MLIFIVSFIVFFVHISLIVAESRSIPVINDLRVGEHVENTRLVVEVSQSTVFRAYMLEDPPRLVVDFPNARWGATIKEIIFNQGLINKARFGEFGYGTVRIAIDLSEPAEVANSFVLKSRKSKASRVVIDLKGILLKAPVSSVVDSEVLTLSGKQQNITKLKRLSQNIAKEKAEHILTPRLRPKSFNATAKSQKFIVIDAGHGGRDPGAVVNKNIYEKNLTLRAAKVLKKLLVQSGYKVYLTRSEDVYLPLAIRPKIAQDENADLFISLHADKHRNSSVNGTSVYTLSERASDAETEALARRENSVDVLFSDSFSDDYDKELRAVLISLVQRTTMTCSARLANQIVETLSNKTNLLGRPHRFAGFRVLKAPKVPSILLEMGYLSNNSDRDRLSSKAGILHLMKGLRKAINSYFLKNQTC